jgi:putative endonuclease
VLNQILGKKGEQIALIFLKKKGYSILSQNFKCKTGEIDIIVKKDECTIFVEVKTRIGNTYGLPEEAVTSWKIKSIIKTADYFMMVNPKLPKLMQIDVISLELSPAGEVKSLKHFKNVTG